MTVACGDGAIRVLEAQRAGSVVVPGHELIRRESLSPGAMFKLLEKSSPTSEERLEFVLAFVRSP